MIIQQGRRRRKFRGVLVSTLRNLSNENAAGDHCEQILHIEVSNFQGMLLNKISSWFDFVAH